MRPPRTLELLQLGEAVEPNLDEVVRVQELRRAAAAHLATKQEDEPVVNASLLTANAVSDLSVHVSPLCRLGIKQRTGGMLPELCNSGATTPGCPQNRAEVIALPGTRWILNCAFFSLVAAAGRASWPAQAPEPS